MGQGSAVGCIGLEQHFGECIECNACVCRAIKHSRRDFGDLEVKIRYLGVGIRYFWGVQSIQHTQIRFTQKLDG